MTIELEVPIMRSVDGKKWVWLSSNDRLHWAQKARIVKWYRWMGKAVAMSDNLPSMQKAHITATIHKNNNRAYDPHNLIETVKPIIDGLIDHGFLPDDSAEYLVGPDMRKGQKRATPCITLTITKTE